MAHIDQYLESYSKRRYINHQNATLRFGSIHEAIHNLRLCRVLLFFNKFFHLKFDQLIYQQQGLDAFNHNERLAAKQPLQAGPFKAFLSVLHHIQQRFPSDTCPIRTALVTARQAPSHERVILTLRSWNIRIDEALFLGGLNKTEFLFSFGADIFFDDQQGHCQLASQKVATAHVPAGISNE